MLLDKKIPLGYIINKIKTELIYVVAIALLVYYITTAFRHIIPEIPLSIPAFLGTAISVLLSFKLNQSYDRWWEARKIWGTIVNESRNLILQLQALTQAAAAPLIKRIVYRHIGWCFSLGQALRGRDALDGIGKYLPAEDEERLKRHHNIPLGLLQLNNEDLKQMRQSGYVDVFSHTLLLNTLANLMNAMGMAERIKSTIFPVTYRLFLHMIIYLFIATLSISLRDLKSYFEIPLLVIIAAFFFLLERTATHMQDPFSDKPTDTAITAIATTIEINIRQLLGETDVPAAKSPEGFYVK